MALTETFAKVKACAGDIHRVSDEKRNEILKAVADRLVKEH